ncbi:hypothetical protein GF380_06375 [Candidatus Uhrbacteria bacterium]|nr:hypothetical protein [Candidatus Uhrbacteria bacterium]MBD3284575.1 hypothetical protein [Candidatus Uhrbacteria bacterium]
MQLRKATQSRVVETVVASSERQEEGEVQVSDLTEVEDETIRRHLEAQKSAEQGADIAKQLERRMRLLEKRIEELPQVPPGEDQVLDEVRARFAQVSIGNFAVKQMNGQFKLVIENPDAPGGVTEPQDVGSVQEGIYQLIKDVEAKGRQLQDAYFEAIRNTYPKLTREYMPQVQRMRNEFIADEEAFNAYMQRYQ